jgi:hypothetical protein
MPNQPFQPYQPYPQYGMPNQNVTPANTNQTNEPPSLSYLDKLIQKSMSPK